MPAKVDNLDAAMLLEKRREQNRAAQKRFREKRAAKQQQEQRHQQPPRGETTYSAESSFDDHVTVEVPAQALWADAVPVHSAAYGTGPWAPAEHQPKLQQRPSQTASSSSASPFTLLGYHSDVDISSCASSSGHSFSSPSTTEEITPSPPAADRDVPPATFETTAAQLDLFGLSLPSPQQESQDDTSPELEVVQNHGDLETMRDIGLFGGGESWVRPPLSSPTPALPSQTSEQPFDLARLLMPTADGMQRSFGNSNSSNGTFAGYGAGASGSTSYGNAQANMVPLEFAWTLAQVMSRTQGISPLQVMQSGQLSPASMRSIFCPDPHVDSRMQVKPIAFASAMRVNLITLGYLIEDAETCDTNVIANVWKKQSARYIRRGPDGRYIDDVEDPKGRLALSFPNVPTQLSTQFYCGTIPKSLSRSDQIRRIRSLRNAPNIHPTKLQLEVPHSIFIDVLPWPSVRDRLIRLVSAGEVDIHDVKGDLVGKDFGTVGAGNTVQIHGDDPLDEESWELSEHFLQKYHVCLQLGPKIIRRTNFWRRMRGEPDVVLDKGGAEQAPSEMASKAAETRSQSQSHQVPGSDAFKLATGVADPMRQSSSVASSRPSLSMNYDLETTLEELLANQAEGSTGMVR
ncbi:hypothetical protein BCV69DRAFT_3149 [Microstroma glucosiphilum]|uniref:BZIP domain-containing protein n=1 Tax=Pseudomicrostroma glucosiphilum TaxID=1684307 RepID=A0A316UF66_9BASI|nr:hypothetical protein BCV69DRAFT_3149 [Pseudomicrostroma glucosiphilum]PWN23564.1 hypothetical protein BCV69DRAFT_3149 [Pseudomicrostroma glucosiphilum]